MVQKGQKTKKPVEPQEPTQSEPITEAELEALAVPKFTHDAIGVYQTSDTFRWVLAELKFDPISGQAQVVKTTEMGDGRSELNEKVKIRSIDLGLVT